MRFALLGTHPDGIDMACALVETGRHQLVAYTSAEPVPDHILRRWGEQAHRLHDLEDLLADPEIDAVIVAGTPDNRTVQLRRALQSERHVLCVHPADQNPDTAYEAAMIQADTQRVVFPLLPEALHPGFHRLADWIRSADPETETLAPQDPLATAVTSHHVPHTTRHSPLTTRHLTTQYRSSTCKSMPWAQKSVSWNKNAGCPGPCAGSIWLPGRATALQYRNV